MERKGGAGYQEELAWGREGEGRGPEEAHHSYRFPPFYSSGRKERMLGGGFPDR